MEQTDHTEDSLLGDWARINKANWDSRVPHHEEGYALHKFADPAFLSGVVRFDVPRLGDISGLRGVHLQCHIGTDTTSLARLGARMTGLDFSEPALEVARRLAADCAVQIDYVESDLYSAPQHLPSGAYDFVYTGVGALCWLPDVSRWAQVVAGLLKPGGFLFIREGHPVVWTMCDPRPDHLLVVEFPYFESDGTVFVQDKSYVEHEGALAEPMIVHFNHGLAEIFNALWNAGLTVTLFEEHRSLPWNAFHPDAMVQDELGEWWLREGTDRMPMSYTLRAVKN